MSQTRDIFSISRLNREISQLLTRSFPLIWLEGEISNFTKAQSGHLYFSLKDDAAQVRAAMFRNQNRHLQFTPKQGMHVLARARISLYEPRGDFQIIIEHMEEAGAGALQRAFEALKAKLNAEGLFDPSRKQAIPNMPARIGVITSPSGAAIRDVVSTLKRRWPLSTLIIYPATVQGAQAPQDIVAALALAKQRNEVDALLLVRGGGSLEDLQAFNDEQVARAIDDCTIPVISGVGHEIDFTIADFVADMRAATPTASAELVSPDQLEVKSQLAELQENLVASIQSTLTQSHHRVHTLTRQLSLLHPAQIIEHQSQTLDNLVARLKHNQASAINQYRTQLSNVSQTLWQQSPLHRLAHYRLQFNNNLKQLHTALRQSIKQKQQTLFHILQTLNTVSPLATLQRGYAIAFDGVNKTVITNINQVKIGDTIKIQLHKGLLTTSVTGASETDYKNEK